MRKIFLIIFFVIILALFFGYLSDLGGDVNVTIGQYEIIISLNFAIVLLIFLIITATSVLLLLRYTYNLPQKLVHRVKQRKSKKGYRYLCDGFFALEAQDVVKARTYAHKAYDLLQKDPLVLMLQYRVADKQNQPQKIKDYLKTLLQSHQTRGYALKHLYQLAVSKNDELAMQNCIQQALKEKSTEDWAQQIIIDTAIKDKKYQKAAESIEQQKKLFQKNTQSRKLAILYLAQMQSMKQYRAHKALPLAKKAYELQKDFVPAICSYCLALIQTGKEKKARAMLEKFWSKYPHNDIIQLYNRAGIEDGPYERIQRLQQLEKNYGKNDDLTYVMASEALSCKRFNQAREILRPLLQNNSQRVFHLMAEIEAQDHRGSVEKSSRYYNRALHARPDCAWIAGEFVSDSWLAVEPLGNTLDSFEWKRIPHRLPLNDTENNDSIENIEQIKSN